MTWVLRILQDPVGDDMDAVDHGGAYPTSTFSMDHFSISVLSYDFGLVCLQG